MCSLSRQVINTGVAAFFECQRIEDLAALALCDCIQGVTNYATKTSDVELGGFAQPDDSDARSAYASQVGEYDTAAKLTGGIAIFQVAFERTLAGGVYVDSPCRQFAFIVDTDNDAIDGAA